MYEIICKAWFSKKVMALAFKLLYQVGFDISSSGFKEVADSLNKRQIQNAYVIFSI